MNNKKKFLDAQEAIYLNPRLLSLKTNPIKGNFDIEHLKAINHYLFQDFPKSNIPEFKKYTPGEFRKENTREGLDWIKKRELKSLGYTGERAFVVAFSDMTETDQKNLAIFLEKTASPQKIKSLPSSKVPEALANLYSNLDYIHPFNDGNSRTLRVFTQLLAKEAGYNLDWDKLNPNVEPEKRQKFHDMLYVARDIETTKKALPNLKHLETKQHIFTYYHSIKSNKKLHEVFKDIISPIKEKAKKKPLDFSKGRERC